MGMTERRTYTKGTLMALITLSRGSCYFPSCGTPIIRFQDSEPVPNVQTSHIRALNKNGPRYDPTLTVEERNSFANLIFLCTMHHTWVDRLHSDDYPCEMLEEWKSEREAGGQGALIGLQNVTEESLQIMIADAFKQRNEIIEEALDELLVVNREAAGMLRGLFHDVSLMRRPAIDEGTVIALDRASRELSRTLDEGVINTLDRAADRLLRATQDLPRGFRY
jgi:hypothetical protein